MTKEATCSMFYSYGCNFFIKFFSTMSKLYRSRSNAISNKFSRVFLIWMSRFSHFWLNMHGFNCQRLSSLKTPICWVTSSSPYDIQGSRLTRPAPQKDRSTDSCLPFLVYCRSSISETKAPYLDASRERVANDIVMICSFVVVVLRIWEIRIFPTF